MSVNVSVSVGVSLVSIFGCGFGVCESVTDGDDDDDDACKVEMGGKGEKGMVKRKRDIITSRRGLLTNSSGILEGFLAKTIVLCWQCRSSLRRQMPAGPVPPKTRTLPPAILCSRLGQNRIYR